MVLAGLGLLLWIVGAIWLVITAIQTGQTTGEKALWGIVNFCCQPIGGIIFYIVKRQGLIPLILVIIGVLLYGGGIATSLPEMMRQMERMQ